MQVGEQTPSPSASREHGLVARVARELAGDGDVVDVAALAGDRPDAAAVASQVRDRTPEGAVIACSGLLERLADFAVVIDALVAASADRGATVVLGVPNHEFATGTGSESVWGEGALRELRGLVPDPIVLHEIAVRGSALVAETDSAQLRTVVEVDTRAVAPVGYVIVFGSRAASVQPQVEVAAADVSAERERERALVAELEVLRAETTR